MERPRARKTGSIEAPVSDYLQTVIDGIPDQILVIDLDYRVVLANRAARDIAGGGDAVARGLTCYQVSHHRDSPCDGQDNPCPLTQVIATKKSVEVTHRHCDAEGWPREVEIVASPIFNGDGEVVQMIESCNDITKHRQAKEQTLRRTAVLDAINEVFRETLKCETDEDVARTCLAVAEELTDSKFGFIGEVNKDGRFDTLALSDPGWDACRMPQSDAVMMITDMDIRGLWGRALTDGRSIIANDPVSHPDHTGTPEGHPPIASFLGVSLKRDGKTFGMIALANKEGGYHLADQEDIEALSVAFVEALFRKRAEEALGESEQMLRSVFSSMDDLLLVLDENGVFLDYYQRSEKFEWHVPLEESLGKSFEEVLPPPVSDKLQSAIKALVATNTVQRFNFCLEMKDGWLKWYDAKVSMRTNSNGRFLGVAVVCRDITERERIETELRTTVERIRLLFDQSHVGMAYLDRDLRFLAENPAMAEIDGLSLEDYTGKTVMEILGDDSPAVEFLREVVRTGEPVHARRVPVKIPNRKDRQPGYYDATFSPLRNTEGEITGVACFVLDITERKRAEEDKARLETQLHRSQKLQALGTLAGGIAHDFGNILMAIMGYTELTMDDLPESSPAQANLEQVLRAGNNARDLVHQILTFSRQVEQERKPVQIHSIVKEALKLLQASLPPSIEIRENIETECGVVLADTSQIHQVVMNLGTNAYHAMRDHGGVLEVNLDAVEVNGDFAMVHPDLQEGTYLRLTISDTGHGMDHSTIERIFEPFFTTKEVDEGTGMGLSVVHGIVTSYSGAITVSSEPGKGTTFRVYLPELSSGFESEASAGEPIAGDHERILFVDDEEQLARMGQQILERLGYEVTARTSSVEALEAFRARPDKFDLVITDETMPNMTGVELAGELMRIRPDIPIILIIGFSDTITRERAEKMGIREFIMKPVVPRDLGKAIRQVLDQE